MVHGSHLDLERDKAKKEVVELKLENPTLTVRELQKKTWIDKSTVSRVLKKELWDFWDENLQIVTIAKEVAVKGLKRMNKFIDNVSDSELQNTAQFNAFSQWIAKAHAIASVIEWYQAQNQQWNIPQQVNIQIINNNNGSK